MFEQAVNCVSGVTASPLEAQLSMLLWMSCDLGGWGYRNFENNYRIVLSNNAKTLIDTDHAEVDMRVLSPDGTKEWMVECQARSSTIELAQGPETRCAPPPSKRWGTA